MEPTQASARTNVYRYQQLRTLLAPRSVAVVGASERKSAFGNRVLANLAAYDGAVYRVNARYASIDGHLCFPDLAALPEVPDCVLVAVAREAVEPVVQQCAALGVGGIIVIASGYAETAKPDRMAQQQRLVAIARQANMRLIGPNTIGLANYAVGAGLTFSAMPARQPLQPHAIGIVSQSGAMGFALGQAVERGTSVSHILTSGNSCDVDMADLVAYLAEDPACRAIACVFEGMANPLRMIEAAELAWQANKPLVLYKMATGEQGAQAAMSHTGSLAGSNAAYAAGFARAGVIQVHQLEALVETAAFFAKAPRPTARGVAVIATSGGAAIMAADKAELHGMPLPQPGEAARAVLETQVPEFGSPRNPCDVTAQVISDPNSLLACVDALLGDPAFAALVSPQAYAYGAAAIRLPVFSDAAARHGKIVCNVWMTELLGGPGARETESDPHLALFHSMDRCFATLAAWRTREDRRQAPTMPPARVSPLGAAVAGRALLEACPDPALTERAAKRVLAAYGVPVIAEELVQTAEQAMAAAEALGFPVALKVESPDILHKTEAGVVRLDLRTPDAVGEAARAILAAAHAVAPAARIAGVLVQPMARKGVEVMIGARRDPLFGPLVVVGLGGIMVEVLKDTAVALAPVQPHEALAMLRGLKGHALLAGFRGAEPVDLEALADIVCRVSELAADHAGQIAELDVNPLICAGREIVAVDALIVRGFAPSPIRGQSSSEHLE